MMSFSTRSDLEEENSTRLLGMKARVMLDSRHLGVQMGANLR